MIQTFLNDLVTNPVDIVAVEVMEHAAWFLIGGIVITLAVVALVIILILKKEKQK